ncbi:hypothetical protein, partial [Cronobacter sakazakii]|uniref:hypothetical protein n=1 Tax=Cronobacter sakazakii TaxID=28141 RepID=UPI0018F892A0
MSEAHHNLRENYLIRNEKIRLMQQIVDRQLTMVPDLSGIRPTKLLHASVREGVTMSEAHHNLRENYLIRNEK